MGFPRRCQKDPPFHQCSGLVSYGLEKIGPVEYVTPCVCYAVACSGMVWYGLIWCGTVWHGTVCFALVCGVASFASSSVDFLLLWNTRHKRTQTCTTLFDPIQLSSSEHNSIESLTPHLFKSTLPSIPLNTHPQCPTLLIKRQSPRSTWSTMTHPHQPSLTPSIPHKPSVE